MKHEMRVIDRTGHTSIKWSEDNAAEVAIAKAGFDEAIKKGYRAFRTTGSGNDRQGDPMRTFDASAESMLLVAPVAGG
jgi:hypothetical protein